MQELAVRGLARARASALDEKDLLSQGSTAYATVLQKFHIKRPRGSTLYASVLAPGTSDRFSLQEPPPKRPRKAASASSALDGQAQSMHGKILYVSLKGFKAHGLCFSNPCLPKHYMFWRLSTCLAQDSRPLGELLVENYASGKCSANNATCSQYGSFCTLLFPRPLISKIVPRYRLSYTVIYCHRAWVCLVLGEGIRCFACMCV